MYTIFMSFGNSKTSDPHRLLLNPSKKICCFIKPYNLLYIKSYKKVMQKL